MSFASNKWGNCIHSLFGLVISSCINYGGSLMRSPAIPVLLRPSLSLASFLGLQGFTPHSPIAKLWRRASPEQVCLQSTAHAFLPSGGPSPCSYLFLSQGAFHKHVSLISKKKSIYLDAIFSLAWFQLVVFLYLKTCLQTVPCICCCNFSPLTEPTSVTFLSPHTTGRDLIKVPNYSVLLRFSHCIFVTPVWKISWP